MKVIQLSTGHIGGAGLAARRLNEALNASGIDSTFVALDHKDFIPGAQELSINRSWVQKLLGGVLARLQQNISSKTLFTPFGVNSISLDRLIDIAHPTETILQIHNYQNLVTEKSILRYSRAGYKILLTLHDQRFFTGGCHYSFDCRKFESSCEKCPITSKPLSFIPSIVLKKNPLRKINRKDIIVVAPSSWMINQAQSSLILKEFDKRHIPNVVGNEWINFGKNIKREDSGKFLVGVASMNPHSYIKGGDLVKKLEESDLFSVVYLSDYSKKGLSQQFWESINYLFVPSRADNSPNVILEAKSLNIPVIASNVGGIPELLDPSDFCLPLESLTPENLKLVLNGGAPRVQASSPQSMNSESLTVRDQGVVNQYLRAYRDLI